MQYLVHGTASRRFGLMSSSQCMQTPKLPSATRPRALLTCRNRLDSRSKLRIASSRSPANCTSSRASGVFSIAMSSRLRSPRDNSACLASSTALYFSSSVLFIGPSPSFYGQGFVFFFVLFSSFLPLRYRRKIMPKVSPCPLPQEGYLRVVIGQRRLHTRPLLSI